jgi:hypothetical protein
MRRLFLIALMLGFTMPALAIAPDGKGLFCVDQAIADETPDIDLVIGAKFIAFWFDSGRALTTKWQRRNDEIILRSSPTGSSYVTSSEKIGWISTAHTADGTREETYSIDRKTLVAKGTNPRRTQEFTCEILPREKQYKLKLAATRDALQDQYNARLAANQF